MKLIIDIPQAEYELVVNDEACGLNVLTRAIAKGTPLDDIKEEIRARVFDIQSTSDKYFDGVDDVMDIVDSVIDKHKGE